MNNHEALETLAELRAVGLAFVREGDSLRVRPSSKLTEARRQAIVHHKRDLLVALDVERVASEIIARAARRGIHSPSPVRQAATPGPVTKRLGLLSQTARGPGDGTP